MTVTVTQDERWAEPCLAYNLQTNLASHTAQALCRLQQLIAQRLPVRLLLPPAASMHISLYALVYVHWNSPHKQAYWQQIAEPTLARLEQVCSAQPSFTVRFTQLRVTERAIIALAPEACEPITLVRRRLAELLASPDLPRPNHDIVHTTLARFAESSLLDAEAVRALEQLPLALDAQVSTLSVMREHVYPSLASEEVRRFLLLAPPPARAPR